MNVTVPFLPNLPGSPDAIVLEFGGVSISSATAGVGARWNVGAPRDKAGLLPWRDTTRNDKRETLPFDQADPLHPTLRVEWGDNRKNDRFLGLQWGELRQQLDAGERFLWGVRPPLDRFSGTQWGELQLHDNAASILSWGAPKPLERAWRMLWGSFTPQQRELLQTWRAGQPVNRPEQVRWGPGPGQGPINPPIVIPIPTDPNNPPLPPVPVRQVYYMNNTVTLLRLPDLTPIEAFGVTLDADRDSWAWTLQATLARPSDIELLEPDSSGPKILKVALNGWPWAFRVESYTTDERFSSRTYTINGRSLSAELAQPTARLRTNTYTTDMNAQQIALAELEGSGWTLDWQLLDWLVPAGTFGYSQKATMDVLGAIAASVGGSIQSDPFNKILTALPRYPVSPKNFASATPDVVLPREIILTKPLSYTPNPAYNRVFVSGQANGYLVRVTRDGTLGDLPAPQVVDPLMCAPEANTARGRYILDSSGPKSLVQVQVPLFTSSTSPGLLQVGQLLQVNDPTPWRAVVTGIQIVAGRPEIWQTAKVERSYL